MEPMNQSNPINPASTSGGGVPPVSESKHVCSGGCWHMIAAAVIFLVLIAAAAWWYLAGDTRPGYEDQGTPQGDLSGTTEENDPAVLEAELGGLDLDGLGADLGALEAELSQ